VASPHKFSHQKGFTHTSFPNADNNTNAIVLHHVHGFNDIRVPDHFLLMILMDKTNQLQWFTFALQSIGMVQIIHSG
jgi:hypothetical protein